ncbi:MAG: hypothetical protein AAFP85_13130 [Pseudomonadota bacterium]
MINGIKITIVTALCATAGLAQAGGETAQPAYVNDMPFPAEMPVYTPRVVFDDLPFHDLSGGQQVAVFGDMPFPAEIKDYVPIRHYADMPTPADMLADRADQAMLQVTE